MNFQVQTKTPPVTVASLWSVVLGHFPTPPIVGQTRIGLGAIIPPRLLSSIPQISAIVSYRLGKLRRTTALKLSGRTRQIGRAWKAVLLRSWTPSPYSAVDCTNDTSGLNCQGFASELILGSSGGRGGARKNASAVKRLTFPHPRRGAAYGGGLAEESYAPA